MLSDQLNSIELFSGAGGLALGMMNAGFNHTLLIEYDEHAAHTLRVNFASVDTPSTIIQSDVREMCFKQYKDNITIVAGGPPCQPFSIGGKHKAAKDKRNMFPEAIRAIRQIRPKAFIFENVKGLLRKNFSDYFRYILLQLTYPSVKMRKNEQLIAHFNRLESLATQDACMAEYDVFFQLVNAADYGVPQKRERVFIVGFRKDLAIDWVFPQATHSKEALDWQQWVTGEYWERLTIPKRDRIPMTVNHRNLARKLDRRYGLFTPDLQPWVTVREAIQDLPCSKVPNLFSQHVFKAGAKSYPGHTGSPIDQPAKTLKAGDHGVPGGENMIRFNNDTIRYFTVREAARLQTFPDRYEVAGSWGECMRQIGNAVPVRLSEIVAKSVYQKLIQAMAEGN